MSIIEIEGLSFRYPDGTKVLDRISLRVEKGTLVVVVGPNGSGKTTLIKHLNGLLLPQAGTVRIGGLAVEQNLRLIRQWVGMIFQDADSQIVGETVAADVAFGPENLGLEPDEIDNRVADCLRAVSLSTHADQQPHTLSGGEKRRLAIAGVLAMKPRIIVFDEPFGSLDYPGTLQVLAEMVRLKRAGQTLVVTTHDLDKILPYADRLIVISGGCIVRDGAPSVIAGEVEAFGVRPPYESRPAVEAASWPS